MPNPSLEVHQATRVYPLPDGGSVHALKAVTLAVASGEFVAVVGRSGSGKSTLLNLVAGLDRPSSGHVTLAGAVLSTLDESALAMWRGRHIGVVFQFFQLLPTLTVLENILFAMELVGAVPADSRLKRATGLLAQVGIRDQQHKLPSTLSGGQQQRAAVARALANDPTVLVADEPTGNLDSSTGAALIALLRALRDAGKALVVVTHDKEVAAAADRVITLHDGEIQP